MTERLALSTGGGTISHYHILERLGSGGMGVVYAAEDSRLGRKVALKVLRPEMAGSPERRRRFEREARALAALNHPNIVALYSVEEASEALFITMELVEGRTLRQILDTSGPLPFAELVEIAAQAAEALAEAHARKLVHRDLKPQNVMVTREGKVKILDFGLVKLLDRAEPCVPPASEAETLSRELSGVGKAVGTLAYMSPEQLLGADVDGRSDLFAFGTMLYELATGRHPFQGVQATSTMAQILEARPEPLTEVRPELPKDLERIIGRCLRRNAAERYTDTRELVQELRSLERPPRPCPSANTSTRLLLVEDEPSLARGLADNFRDEGFEVRVVGRGDEAVFAVQDFHPDLLVLDLTLPGRSGLDVLRELRAGGRSLPILVLTAKSDVVDRVVGLELGADDYMPKPFAARELLARVRALLRRSGRLGPADRLSRGEEDMRREYSRTFARHSRRAILMAAVVIALLGAAAATADQKKDSTALMTQGKLDADLGDYRSATEAFALIAGDAAGPAALRWEALVRLGLARSAAGDAKGSGEAFKQVIADYSGDPEAIRFLTYATARAVPGKIWLQLTAEFESLLRTADIVSVEDLGMGESTSKRVHLRKEDVELKAAWRPARPQGGPSDSYQAEITAYELDKALELNMVPPTVERSLQNRKGSLQLWVNGCRVYKEVQGELPETSDWSRQISRMKLFDSLIGNQERNATNILIDPNWQVALVDFSRAFPSDAQIKNLPAHFDRQLVEKLRALDQEGLQRRLRGIMGKSDIQNIIRRRDAILAHLE